MNLSDRSDCRNPLNHCLFNLMNGKCSNLCLSVDLDKSKDVLSVVDRFGPHVVAIKLHVDIIEDFDHDNFVKKLIELKEKHKFLIIEDRKFADIGATVIKQYVGGIYRIRDWADLVTSHVMLGIGPIEALMKSVTSSEPRGVILIAQMSHEGSGVNEVERARSIAIQYPDFVSGVVSQSPILKDPGFIQFTPGVNISSKSDGMGQQYVTPEEAITTRGADIIIVGRGILKADDPLERILEFKRRGFEAYLQKVIPSKGLVHQNAIL